MLPLILILLGILLIIAGVAILLKTGKSQRELETELPQPQKQPEQEEKLSIQKVSGMLGEFVVHQFLDGLPVNYICLNDIMLSTGSSYTQIDHIVVSPYGIFCIETKNYKGMIHGEGELQEWNQTLGKKPRSFYSPILQNRAHIDVLNRFLSKTGNAPIFSIVAFVNDCCLKVENLRDNEYVIQAKSLLSTILSKKEVLLTDAQIAKTLEILNKANVIDPSIRKKHEQDVERKRQYAEVMSKAGICPRCGAPLVLKTSRSGKSFWGCSNYPDCTFTLKDK